VKISWCWVKIWIHKIKKKIERDVEFLFSCFS
jgi:hypothetical protein